MADLEAQQKVAKLVADYQSLALDAELVLRMLKPIRVKDCGYLIHRATGWYGPGNGGPCLSLEFRWAGPNLCP